MVCPLYQPGWVRNVKNQLRILCSLLRQTNKMKTIWERSMLKHHHLLTYHHLSMASKKKVKSMTTRTHLKAKANPLLHRRIIVSISMMITSTTQTTYATSSTSCLRLTHLLLRRLSNKFKMLTQLRTR